MWIEKFSEKSYRSIAKWGAKDGFHHPSEKLLNYVRENFGFDDVDFSKPHLPGLGDIKPLKKPKMKEADIKKIERIVGKDNVDTDDYTRAYHAVSAAYRDVMNLRKEEIPYPPDVVVYPRGEEDVVKLVKFCNEKKIPITPFAGRSSVTYGTVPMKGGISLDVTKHMNKVLEVDDLSFTCRVQPGMFGPAYEEYLNNYKSDKVKNGFTCGHFPQSFEYSCVGGWVVTRGAGGQSTGYGKIEDITVSMRMVTPAGLIVTKDFPAASIGPDIDEFLMGSEGAFGVMTEATLKIFPFNPDDRQMFTWFFKNWDEGLSAMREIMQGGFGLPSMLRISDPEETDLAMMMMGFEGTLPDKVLRLLGYKPGKRVILLGSSEGDPDHGKLIKKKVRKISRRHGGLGLGEMGVKGYWSRRYNDPYMREDLLDLGIMSDTLETACTWSNIKHIWEEGVKVVKGRPNTISMVHASHCYENGANLYFIFLSPMAKGKEIEDYTKFQSAIINAILKAGGSLSHHHGIGKMFAPWYKEHLGSVPFGMIKAVKNFLDPKNIMNPGGTLGLDQKEKGSGKKK